MYNTLKDIIDNQDYSVAESFEIEPREARFRGLPEFLAADPVGDYLREITDSDNLWLHQALALERINAGDNVVISTSTASGKSLIFQSAAFHTVLNDKDARVLVFYPLKALASDQMRSWTEMAQALGLPTDVVGRIDGSVDTRQREDILRRSRVIIMTPDVCHAWLMARVAMPEVREFLGCLSHIIMDEAHTLEGVFGSNFAFLLRRIFAARTRLKKATLGPRLQLIGATATIANPSEHMQELTGQPFAAVDEEQDGAPRYQRFCAHLVCPEGEEMKLASEVQRKLLQHATQGSFITFLDSRKGVETLAITAGARNGETLPTVMPYRAGYASEDRMQIERALQEGTLKGVVSTSALELGIDLPHLSVGLNVGVPGTRKSYRQRIGRVGRKAPGGFVVIAGSKDFRGYGTSYRDYHDMSVEPSYLYLSNQFMQFAHARCLFDELDSLGAGTELPKRVHWPEGFDEIYKMARPGGNLPQKFDAVAQLGGDTPQRSYPLRNVAEINFNIAEGSQSEGFGEITEAQALRECYPGGTYMHMGHAYEVTRWESNSFRPCIRVKRTNPRRQTRPRIITWINTGINPGDLQESNILASDQGFIAEAEMQITEKVEGYTDDKNEFRSYRDLRAKNPNLRPRQRNFRTTGVILCIKDKWFLENGVKHTVADWVSRIFCREYSVLPQDVGVSSTRISVSGPEGTGLRSDCIVLFDQTYGSLRLTERLFTEFDAMLERLRASANAEEGAEKEHLLDYVDRIQETYDNFSDAPQLEELMKLKQGESALMQVFTPGSRVYMREIGNMGTEVEIVEPSLIDGELMYRIKVESKRRGAKSARRWVHSRTLEPSAEADAWSIAPWDPETEEYETEENGFGHEHQDQQH